MAGELYRDLQDIRPSGTEIIKTELYRIPVGPLDSGSYSYRLLELPLAIPLSNPAGSWIEVRETDSLGNDLAGPVYFTAVVNGVLSGGSFLIKTGTVLPDDTMLFGRIYFSHMDSGRYVKILYTGRGSLVFASDVTDVCKGLSLLPHVILPDHISNSPTDSFSFPADVNVAGNLNVTGTVNKSISEVLTTSDDVLMLNSDFVGATASADCGVEVNRGGTEPNVSLKWYETPNAWGLIGGPLGVGTAAPDQSAMIDVASTTKGLLGPRMTTAQRDAISSPALGLEVFNTTTGQKNIWNGSAWAPVGSPASGPLGAIQFSDGTGLFSSDDSHFHWDPTAHTLGLGTLTPMAIIHVVQNNVDVYHDSSLGIEAYSPDAGRGAAIGARRAKGTELSPAQTVAGDVLLMFEASGRGLTGFSDTLAAMLFSAEGDTTATSQPSAISFLTTPVGSVGSTGRREVARLTSAGELGLGVSLPAAKLDVAGTFKLTDGSQAAALVLTSDVNGLASWKDWAPNLNRIAVSISGDVITSSGSVVYSSL